VDAANRAAVADAGGTALAAAHSGLSWAFLSAAISAGPAVVVALFAFPALRPVRAASGPRG